MIKNYFLLAIFFSCILFFCSCSVNSRQTVFLADRHSLSYEVIEKYSQQHEALTLVILDSYDDTFSDSKTVTTLNWIEQLIAANITKKIYWVSTNSYHELEKTSATQHSTLIPQHCFDHAMPD